MNPFMLLDFRFDSYGGHPILACKSARTLSILDEVTPLIGKGFTLSELK